MNTMDDARSRADDIKPAAMTLKSATKFLGVSRSALYRLAAQGRVRLLKYGRATLLDVSSAEAFLRSLPEAQIGQVRKEAV